MERLLSLLKDGHARTTDMLASELQTSPADIKRKLEYLERMHVIRRLSLAPSASCGEGCKGCEGGHSSCKGCLPDAGLLNMGEMWEVVV